MNYTITDNNYNRLLKKPSINTEQLMEKKPWKIFGVEEMSKSDMENIIKIIEFREG